MRTGIAPFLEFKITTAFGLARAATLVTGELRVLLWRHAQAGLDRLGQAGPAAVGKVPGNERLDRLPRGSGGG